MLVQLVQAFRLARAKARTPLFRRLAKHKSNFKSFQKGKGNYVTSFELLKCNDYYIELVEDFPCERKEQLNSREAHFIRTMNCINKVIPFLTDEEKKQYKSIYRQENKEEIKEKKSIYYQKNKEEIKEKQAIYKQENKEEIKDYNANYWKNHKKELQEKKSIYRNNNLETINEKSKLFYHKNKDDILAKQRVVNTCECGKTFALYNKCQHQRSKFHQNYLQSLEQIN